MANAAWESLIRRHGFTSTEDVGTQMKMSTGHLSNIANGKRDPRLKTARRIAQFIGCSLDDLALAIICSDDETPEVRQVG